MTISYLPNVQLLKACFGIAALSGVAGCGSTTAQPGGAVSAFLPPARSLQDLKCGKFYAVGSAVYDYPDFVKAEGAFSIGLQVSSASRVRVTFKDEAGTLTLSDSVVIYEGRSRLEFSVPVGLKLGKYKLVVTFESMEIYGEKIEYHVKKVETKDIEIVKNITADLSRYLSPGQPPVIENVKVVGQEKLEGVSYVIQAIDKAGGAITELAVADQPGTIEDKNGKRISLAAPGGKPFQEGIHYTVILKDKEGHDLWSGSFHIGGEVPQPHYGRRKIGCRWY